MAISSAIRTVGRALLLAAGLTFAAMPCGHPAAAQTAPAAPGGGASPSGSPPPAQTPPPAAEQSPPSGDASTAQVVNIEARPVALIKGTSTWEDGYQTITQTFRKINAALEKSGIKPTGRPLAMFTETDDNGFKFQGMIPIDKPADKPSLPPDIEIGELPAGKALKFQHRGAYDEIDSTYEAITAYLDERGYEAKNLFVEEYLNDANSSDDTSLAVDIYVYVK